ncbi:coiled-coil domain-containing protein SCD2-like [Melia azedarach]|uniref:Coiled-coil domain-containing protein SCD2-like n=1 Tax=Melia azedarach TaxID=155640 RepID=A0ACC1Y7Z3_MELAZ|nr:coiled-coil domain-containing protein SCD2-like [Melia azedarach]
MQQKRTQMVTPPPVDDDNDEDYDFGLVSGKASIGLAGGRAMQSRTPASKQETNANNNDNYDYGKVSLGHAGGRSMRSPSPLTKTTPQRPKQETPQQHQQANEDNDDDYDYNRVSGRASIGLAGGRSMRSPSPLTKSTPQKYKQEPVNQPANEDEDYDYGVVTGKTSIGLAGGRFPIDLGSDVQIKTTPQKYKQEVVNQTANENKHEDYGNSREQSNMSSTGYAGRKSMRSQPTMAKSTAQRQKQETASELITDQDNDDNYDYDLVSGKASIGLAGGRAMRSHSPNVSVSECQFGNRYCRRKSSYFEHHEAQIKTTAQKQTTAVEENDADDLSYSSKLASKTTIGHAGGRAMRQPSPMSVRTNQEELPSAHSTSGARAYLSVNSVEQPSSVPLTSVERPSQTTRSAESAHSRTASRSSQSGDSIEQPPSAQSTSAVNLNLRGKPVSMAPSAAPKSLRPASSATPSEIPVEKRRDKRLSMDLGNTNFKEVGNQRSASALQDEVANLGEGVTLEARLLSRQVLMDEASSALELLQQAEDEIRALRNMTQRMILTQEEMEEVVLKRCWLARYWNLCVQHGIHSEIAKAKYDYWSSFAPLPVEIVLGAGQRAKEENSSETNAAEEREKVLQDLKEISGEGNIESMLLVEKGLRELALLKVEDAVALAMAQIRRANHLKSDEVKLPSEGQFEAFELTQEESEDTQFKQAWIAYFWRRAINHGLEPDIAEDRLRFWIEHSNRSSSSHDAVEVERGLSELRKLGLESQLWQASRKGFEQDTKSHLESDF